MDSVALSWGRRAWPAAIAAAALCLSTPAQAQNGVSGTMIVDRAVVLITYVSARVARTRPSSDEPGDIKILLLDRVPTPAVAASQQAYIAAGQGGELPGVLLSLRGNSSEGRLISFQGSAELDTSVPDIFQRVLLSDVIRQGRVISGRLHTVEPLEFDGGGGEAGDPRSNALDLRFRVDVEPAPLATATLTGADARRSAPVAAAIRSLHALHEGSAADFVREVEADHPLAAQFSSAPAPALLAMIRRQLPPPQAFAASVRQMILFNDEAIVSAGGGGDQITVSLRRRDGVWRLAPNPIPND